MATVTSAGKESPPSPNLNLTVAPDEAIDLVGITIAHAPLFGDGPPVVDHLRNSAGCASCDGTGFNAWIPGGKPITVSVPVSATGVTSVTVHISATDYILSDPDGDRIYQGTFTPPSVRGVASLEFVVHRAGGLVIEYTCGEIIIDPYGTVYDAAVGPSAPIAGATVRLYYQNPDTLSWSVWSPTGGQDNPQSHQRLFATFWGSQGSPPPLATGRRRDPPAPPAPRHPLAPRCACAVQVAPRWRGR